MAKHRAQLTSSPLQARQRLMAGALCAIFLLQAIIPAGYMPGSLASGTLLQLCPKGVSASLMAVLHGSHQDSNPGASLDGHSHHAHHHSPPDLPVVAEDGLAGVTPGEHSVRPGHGDRHAQWQNECSYGAAAPGVFTFTLQSTDCYFIYSSNHPLSNKVAGSIRKPVFFQRLPRAPPEALV